ncbi:MAG: response regulator transcription factor [Pyrinomonadaceae bacterium]
MKLLIVEDNEQMRCLIKCLVSDLAEDVRECTDGSEALAAYAAERPDWVLMDIKMAHTDGITATRQIVETFPGARIIVVTDYDDPELREAAHAAGACGYVVKENLLSLPRLLAVPPG